MGQMRKLAIVLILLALTAARLASMSALAASPLAVERTPMMMVPAPRRAACRAASRPRPVLAPVMRIVLPSMAERGGRVRLAKNCLIRPLMAKAAMVGLGWCLCAGEGVKLA